MKLRTIHWQFSLIRKFLWKTILNYIKCPSEHSKDSSVHFCSGYQTHLQLLLNMEEKHKLQLRPEHGALKWFTIYNFSKAPKFTQHWEKLCCLDWLLMHWVVDWVIGCCFNLSLRFCHNGKKVSSSSFGPMAPLKNYWTFSFLEYHVILRSPKVAASTIKCHNIPIDSLC